MLAKKKNSKSEKQSPRVSLVGWIEHQDLRRVCQRETYLRKQAQDWELKDGQGVLFTNLALTRFRVIANLGGLPCLIVMPVAAQRNQLISIFLKVSMTLRNGWGMEKEIADGLSEIEQARIRVGRGRYKPALQLVQ